MSLTKKDPSLRVAATDPHLVSLGGGRLSTAVTIHYIHIGDTTIGSAPSCSISLNGSGVRPLHCTIYRSEANEVTVVPEQDARLLIDGARIETEVNLTQGAMITIGNSNYLRFNNPDEAQMMRSAMGSNERISMPQIDFTQSARQAHDLSQSLEMETFYESIINPIGHSAPPAAAKSHRSIDLNGMQTCPKVFSADLITVNMPAKDVLGQKYASFAKNLAENHRGDKQLNNQYTKTLQGAGVGHNSGYCNIPSNAALFKQQNGHGHSLGQSSPVPATRSKPANCDVDLLTKVNNDRYDRYPKPQTYPLQIYPMNGVNTDINNGGGNLSHAELEDMLKICSDYTDRQQLQHNSSHGHSHNASSSSITSSPIVQNRIKTNGSLPRDKKSQFQSSSGNLSSSGAAPTGNSSNCSSSGYENVRLLGPNRVEINGQLHVPAAAPKSSCENLVAGGKYVPQSPRTKIRTNCMSPKKDNSFGGAFMLASPTATAPPVTLPKPPLAPKPTAMALAMAMAPNQQRDYEQLFKSFERKQQLEESAAASGQERSKRLNKNINNLTLQLQPAETSMTASPKLSKKPAPAPRNLQVGINSEPDLARQQQRLKQLKRELAELPAIELEESSGGVGCLLALQQRIHRLEAQRNATRVMEENQQAKLKQSIEMKQDQMKKLRAMLKQKPNNACLKEELQHVCESLDSDRKSFEDLEFQYFEEESEHHACHEDLKRQEQRLLLETELAELRLQLGDTEEQPTSDQSCSPVAGNLLANGVMSQSLFGSAELLCPKRCHPHEDLMSKSVNENMFYNHKIEAATSTPKRAPLQLYEPATTTTTSSNDQISFNLSLRSDRFEVNPLERRVPSQDDIDRSCKVANDAPISTTQGASTKIFDSIKEIERNRKLLLAQQGHQVIEHERQKIYDLKKKSHDEARTQYLLSTLNGQQQQNQNQQPQHAPMNANGGKDAKLFEKTELQKLNSEEQQQQQQQQQKTYDKENVKQTDGGSETSAATAAAGKRDSSVAQQRHSQPELLEHHAVAVGVASPARSPRPLSEANNCEAIETPKFASHGGELTSAATATAAECNSKRASSNSQDTASAGSGSGSSSGGTGGGSSGNGERKRALPKHQRPLTRYLPIFSPDLNLRHHIETAGHQIDLCPHVFVDAHSCRGYLHKLGATFHAWSRRWFVLDRQRSALIYYSDKSERKPRGGAYFATIDEVYLDHLNASKSGRPHCTFIVKTKKRSYQLQAASDAAARIWIDAIITGAQGNLDY